jgi:hypothetical protein
MGGGQVYLYGNVCGESLQLIDNVRLLFFSITDALHIVENTCQALSEKILNIIFSKPYSKLDPPPLLNMSQVVKMFNSVQKTDFDHNDSGPI